MRNGFGNETIHAVGIYEGHWKNNEKSGNGTCFLNFGSKYVGHYENNRRHGYGTKYHPTGQVECSGQWENDKCIGSKH
jgi:hypothetical protein